ncbi:transcriptional regulator [Clostridium sp. Mt-5]|uniref:Transcriptional regulator n=1 Tax=Clostridium moutaii TaxID=3240932 RepID=A0ABV4BSR1_9CLOT
MEILSTGEKIKRARIYKGYTLKSLCDNKISVSKMSCIENDKIKPEQWILEFVADKLEVDMEYLEQDVKSQIIKNINDISKNPPAENYEKVLWYNLKFAEGYSYYNICFTIIHMLFNYHLDRNEFEKMQFIVSPYYEYLQKCFSNKNASMYYMDIARYFYVSKEYFQAINYYDNVLNICRKSDYNEYLAKAMYCKAFCYFIIKDYDKAYELAMKIIDLEDSTGESIENVEVYHMLAVISLKMHTNKFEKYEKKVYELYKNDLKSKSEAMFDYAQVLFSLKKKDRALNYLNKSLDIYPKDNIKELVNFMLMSIDDLVKNKVMKRAHAICDVTLDYAISLNNITFIEKAYYYKALILLKEGDFTRGEMYMNFSLDNLLKFGTSSEIYKRYMEMGKMYYNINNVSESIKYFSFAINLKEKYKFLSDKKCTYV